MKRSRVALGLAFVAGATIMAAEVAASRLLAPHFGSSTPVWGGLIAFVLGGMALGAWAGGRLADRVRRIEPLLFVLAAAAANLAILPFAARWLLSGASTAVLGGRVGTAALSLLVFAALALPPVLALGAVTPWLLALGIEDRARAGAVAGGVSAASTLGSIAGTLLAAFVVLPWLGTARTLAAFAALLALAAGVAGRWRWLPLFLAVPAASLVAAPWALARHPSALAAVESPYALVQVLETRPGLRTLIFDEGFAVQSLAGPPGWPLEEIFAQAVLTPAFARPADPAAPSVLLLGLGGGTTARATRALWPRARIAGVEIDPEVVRLGRRWFGLPGDVEVHLGDARVWLTRDRRRHDAILHDAFRFPYLPFHLTTVEFFRAARAHLAPGGVLFVNIGRWDQARDVVEAVATTAAHVFPEVLTADAPTRGNTLLYAGPPGLRARILDAGARLPPSQSTRVQRLASALRPHRPAPATRPLTDDHAPIEQMTDTIFLRALWRGSVRRGPG